MYKGLALSLYLCLHILVYGQPIPSFGQDSAIQYLEQKASKASSDTARITVFLELVEKVYEEDPSAAQSYLDRINDLVGKNDYHEKDGLILYYQATLLSQKGKYDTALTLLFKAIEIGKEKKDAPLLGRVCIRISRLYSLQDKLAAAMKEALKADSVFTSLNDYKGLAEVRNAMASIAYHEGKYEDSKAHILKARELFEKAEYDEGVAKCNLNLGVICKELGEFELAFSYNQEALKFYGAQGKILEQVFILNNLGYLEIGRKQYREAKEYLEEALTLNDVPQHDFIKVSILEHLGEVNFFLGSSDQAFAFFKEAYSLADSINLETKKLDIAEHLVRAHDSLGNPREGLFWMQKAYTIKDSINTRRQTDALAAMQTQFGTRKTEEENARLRTEKDNQKLRNIAISLGLAFVSVITAVLFLGIRRQNKTNKILAEHQDSIQIQNVQLQEQNKRLESINQEKNMMMGMLAHDIRDPLAKIEGLSNILLDQEGLSAQQETFVGHIRKTSQSLWTMSQRLLDLEALEAGRLRLEKVPTSLIETAHASIAAYENASKNKKVNINLLPYEGPASVIADPGALRQVIDNLISNAIKFSPSRTNIEIGIKEGEKVMGLYIADQGPGIPEKDIPKLFMKFQKLTNEPTAGEKSTGLGLALVKKYMDAMEGEILCVSETGVGTTFTILLPTASSTFAETDNHLFVLLSDKHPG